MIPAWVWTILIVVVGCIAALWLGSSLTDTGLDPSVTLLLVIFAAFCVVCAIYNNFPFLLAFGTWIPFFPHLFGAASFPTIGYFLLWMSLVLFFRLCLQGYLSYRQSFTWSLLIVFAWVPVRFAMNPVTKLGATAGGSGVSGAAPYFGYVLAGSLMVFIGAVLNDRNKITYFMRWCYIIVLLSGIGLTICAFVPATAPYLAAMGSFAAGDISEGVQRLVQLPGLRLVSRRSCPLPSPLSLEGLAQRHRFCPGILHDCLGRKPFCPCWGGHGHSRHSIPEKAVPRYVHGPVPDVGLHGAAPFGHRQHGCRENSAAVAQLWRLRE